MTMAARVALAAAVAALLALPNVAAGQAEPPALPPVTGEAAASEALDDAEAAFQSADPAEADPTEELRDLALALPYLDGAERRRARELLARPPATDQDSEPFGAEWSLKATLSEQTHESPGGRFLIHWVTEGPDAPDIDTDVSPANGVPDYVDTVAEFADESEAVQNDELGWREAKSDGTEGNPTGGGIGPGKTDIYLSDICNPGACVFGYAAPDDPSPGCRRAPFRCYAFLVVDNDYTDPEFGNHYLADPTLPLKVTLAHEYNHVLQFAIDAILDGWMFEATAVWMEEQVFPDADDWLIFARPWARRPGRPLTRFDFFSYGSAVWNHWLELGAGYGPEVVRDAWESSRETDPRHFGAGAYNRAIRAAGGQGFGQEFARFAAATVEWRVADGNFADEGRMRDVRRDGRLRPGGKAKRFELDHTSYRLLRVKPDGRRKLRLRVHAPDGVRTGVALIGRNGSPTGGKIRGADPTFLPRGGRASVRLRRVGRFERITAVIANADHRVRGFGGGDWNYTRDDRAYRVVLRRG